MKKNIKKWEIFGVLFIFIIGTLLHFFYDWSRDSKFVGIFGAVNESVWEHLKLAYWPAIFFMMLEYSYIKRYTNNFLIAKALGILTMPVVIVMLHYSYKALIGHHVVALDILIFAISIILGQLISYKILIAKPINKHWNFIGVIVLVTLGLVFIIFTFMPPDFSIFRGSQSGLLISE